MTNWIERMAKYVVEQDDCACTRWLGGKQTLADKIYEMLDSLIDISGMGYTQEELDDLRLQIETVIHDHDADS